MKGYSLRFKGKDLPEWDLGYCTIHYALFGIFCTVQCAFLAKRLFFRMSKVLEQTRFLNKMHFFEVRSCCGVPSVVSRSSLGGIEQPIREVKEIGFLINSTFCNWEFLGSSLVRPWFMLGL